MSLLLAPGVLENVARHLDAESARSLIRTCRGARSSVESDTLAMASFLLREKGGKSLLAAAAHGDPMYAPAVVAHIVRWLGPKDDMVNAEDAHWRTPLHHAAMRGLEGLARTLIAAGADVKCKDEWMGTPLHDACRSGYVHVARLLIEAGADVDAERDNEDTPLRIACRGGYITDDAHFEGGVPGSRVVPHRGWR